MTCCSNVGSRVYHAIESGVVSGVLAATLSTAAAACALLGREMMRAAGDPVANFSFADVIVPTLAGSVTVGGGLGFILGAAFNRRFEIGLG